MPDYLLTHVSPAEEHYRALCGHATISDVVVSAHAACDQYPLQAGKQAVRAVFFIVVKAPRTIQCLHLLLPGLHVAITACSSSTYF